MSIVIPLMKRPKSLSRCFPSNVLTNRVLYLASSYRFNQPYLIQSNNASLSIRFRMDPITGADQVIEGAFAYFNGTISFSYDCSFFMFCFFYKGKAPKRRKKRSFNRESSSSP